jgi:hypothetical protein
MLSSNAMQAARPNELRTNAFPVVTARVSKSELSKWFPVQFEDITDPEATPEPSKGALAKLANGLYFVLYWGEMSKQLTLRIPRSTDASDFLVALLREVPSLRSRILWHRADAELPAKSPSVRSSFVSLKDRARSFLPFIPASGPQPAQKSSRGAAGSKRSSPRSNRPSSRPKAPARKR